MGFKSNKSYWVCCPLCTRKTRVKIYEDTVLVNFPLFCPSCRKVSVVDVVKLKMKIVNTEE